MPLPGVLVSGNIVYDTLVRPVEELVWGRGTTFVDSLEAHVGGNGANTSRALALLGSPARLLGAIGSDEHARFILEALESCGVDIARLERLPGPSAATVGMVRITGERLFYHCLGASSLAFASAIDFTPQLCEGMTHYHCSAFFVLPLLRARGPEPLISARAAGLTTSFDTNWDPQGGWLTTLGPCLPHVGTLFMNEEEARMIAGAGTPAEQAKVVLAHGLETCVLKLGARGCAIYTQTKEYLVPGLKVDVKDTTGAGDCFVGGYLHASLQGASAAEAGAFANSVAALSVQHLGAVPPAAALRSHGWG